jgi:hypothetical protein
MKRYPIKIDLTDIGWEGVNWIHLAQDKTRVGSYEHGDEPSAYIKDGEVDSLSDR